MLLQKIDNFITEEQCDYLVALIEKNNTRSTVAEGDQASTVSQTRTSYTSNLNPQDETVKSIHNQIAQYIKLPLEKGEALQGQKYQPGQYFREHTDYFEGSNYDKHCLSSGNRVKTVMIYLNDVEKGGETKFPLLDIEFTPKKGTAIMWDNMDKNGNVIPDALHEGSDVIEGTKYIVTSWWRQNTWNGAEDAFLYQKSLEQKTIQMTTEKTYDSYDSLPKFTETGYKIVKVPEDAWKLILESYEILKDKKAPEVFPGKETIIRGNENSSDLLSFDHLPEQRRRLHLMLQPLHEEWSKQELEPSYIYGIRSYNQASDLVMHRDRIATHIISSIICVDKDLTCGCKNKKYGDDWGLQIIDHNGQEQTVYLEPGEMVLYESAKCLHGRKEKFQGKYYRNFFVHYKLKDYKYVGPPQ